MKLLTDIVRSFFVQVRIWPPRKKDPGKKSFCQKSTEALWVFSGFSCIFRRNNGCEGNSAAVLAEL
jgi:hypothetical protein